MNNQRENSGLGLAVLAILLAGALVQPARAAVTIRSKDNVQIGAIFGRGWLYSSNHNHPTADQGGTWDFREMAVNVSTTFGSHLRVGGQVFAQRFGAIGGDNVILDRAVSGSISPRRPACASASVAHELSSQSTQLGEAVQQLNTFTGAGHPNRVAPVASVAPAPVARKFQRAAREGLAPKVQTPALPVNAGAAGDNFWR